MSKRFKNRTLGNAWRHVRNLAEAAGFLTAMSIFACLPVDAASSLGGYMARRVGPHIRVSRIAIRNIRASLPDNSEAENRRILDGMWDNIGRTVAEYPHLAAINARSAGRVQVVNGE